MTDTWRARTREDEIREDAQRRRRRSPLPQLHDPDRPVPWEPCGVCRHPAPVVELVMVEGVEALGGGARTAVCGGCRELAIAKRRVGRPELLERLGAPAALADQFRRIVRRPSA